MEYCKGERWGKTTTWAVYLSQEAKHKLRGLSKVLGRKQGDILEMAADALIREQAEATKGDPLYKGGLEDCLRRYFGQWDTMLDSEY